MTAKLKGKVYETVIRAVMLYVAETWATTKRQEKRDENAMVYVRSGTQRQDQERTHPRKNERVAQTSKNLITERQLNWNGYVMRIKKTY